VTIVVKVSEWYENWHSKAASKPHHYYYALTAEGAYVEATLKQEAGFSFGERIEFSTLDYPTIGKNPDFSPLSHQDHAEAHEVNGQAIAKGWRAKQKLERESREKDFRLANKSLDGMNLTEPGSFLEKWFARQIYHSPLSDTELAQIFRQRNETIMTKEEIYQKFL